MPVLSALRLPADYLITPDLESPAEAEPFLERLAAQVQARALSLVQLRVKSYPREALPALVGAAVARCAPLGARVLLNDAPDVARTLGAGGVHLSASRLAALRQRPGGVDGAGQGFVVGASCHDATELAHASDLGLDFAVLGPVAPTASHPGAAGLGWERFAGLVGAARLPVYALGGVGPEHRPRAWTAGAQGVAGISAYWRG